MVHRSKARGLSVWMNGELVGRWRLLSSGGQEFAYTDEWLASPSARPLSLYLPLRPSGKPYTDEAATYFDNLLPDNAEIRSRMHRRFQTASANAFDLLEQAGRDCVGAVQLVKEGEEPAPVRAIQATPVDDMRIAELLSAALSASPTEGDDDAFRISLAGAQEKTAFLWHNGGWHVPQGTTPSSHIFKLPLGRNPRGVDVSASVENEWLCAHIVRAYGLAVPDCKMGRFGEQKTLIVERFDRKLAAEGGWWLRLPQEDFCQVTSMPPSLKYEEEGRPGIRRIMEVLIGSDHADADRRAFLRAQVVFWLLAATDGHGKNFSLFLLPGSAFRLTPLYDVLSVHPILGHGRGQLAPEKIRMAMALEGKNRHYRWRDIRYRHWLESARRCGFVEMDAVLDELVAMTPAVIDSVEKLLPDDFPAEIASRIFDGVRAAAKSLGEEIGLARS